MSEKPQCKPFWESKTMWLNAAVMLLGVADTLTGALKPFLPPEAVGLIVAGISAANIVLRATTGLPLAASKPSPKSQP